MQAVFRNHMAVRDWLRRDSRRGSGCRREKEEETGMDLPQAHSYQGGNCSWAFHEIPSGIPKDGSSDSQTSHQPNIPFDPEPLIQVSLAAPFQLPIVPWRSEKLRDGGHSGPPCSTVDNSQGLIFNPGGLQPVFVPGLCFSPLMLIPAYGKSDT
jgi:hypothetical protein